MSANILLDLGPGIVVDTTGLAGSPGTNVDANLIFLVILQAFLMQKCKWETEYLENMIGLSKMFRMHLIY